jgi:hypothetical protein
MKNMAVFGWKWLFLAGNGWILPEKVGVLKKKPAKILILKNFP